GAGAGVPRRTGRPVVERSALEFVQEPEPAREVEGAVECIGRAFDWCETEPRRDRGRELARVDLGEGRRTDDEAGVGAPGPTVVDARALFFDRDVPRPAVLGELVVQDLDLQRQPKAGGLAPARPRGERGRYVQYTEHRAPDPARGREPEPPGPGRCRRARVGEPELESLVRPRVVADLAELVALGRDPAEEGAVRLVILGDELADMERRRTGRARPAEADE